MAWRNIGISVPALLGAAVCLLSLPNNSPADEEALWKTHVEPLLKERCHECHSPTKSKSGLDLTSLQSMLRGGDRGSAVVPGHPDQSNLYKFLRGDSDPHMPPGSRKPLTDEESALIAKWIQELPVVAASPATTATNWNPTDYSSSVKHRITWTPDKDMPAENAVDHFLELAWKLDRITPTPRIDDAAFVRRVYLDLIGRIPTTAESSGFVSKRSHDKRAGLIDTLLASDEYARHMRDVFDTVLMTRRGENWEEQRASQKWLAFLENSFRQNKPWNEFVREVIVARPDKPEDRGAVWFLYERENNPQAMAEALAPIAFGVQIKCAQCHDHMIAREIKQAHYWGMVAAFNRSKNADSPNGPALSESAVGGFISFANLKKESQAAQLTFFNGKHVDEVRPREGEKENDSPDLYVVPPSPGEAAASPPQGRRRSAQKVKTAAVPKFSRRAALADAVTRDNPLLARAMVNRMWALLFGRGIVHPVDLMDSKHPPSQPELLDWLARDFEQSNYDVKRLVRTLCNTRAYQLDARVGSAKTVPPPEAFARALDKPLSAEQLFQSLLTATANQPDKDGKIGGRSEKELRTAFVAQFPDLFPAEYNASLQQAMFFANSPLLDTLLEAHEGNLSARLEKLSTNEERVREAFVAIYGRAPARDELRECARYLSGRSTNAGVKQLLWAMLSGAEFQVNH